MKPTNTIMVSAEYIKEKEKQVERLQEQLDIVTEQRNDIHIDKQVLQKQLNEANEVIKKYMAVAFEIRSEEEKPTVLQLAFGYLERWGVK